MRGQAATANPDLVVARPTTSAPQTNERIGDDSPSIKRRAATLAQHTTPAAPFPLPHRRIPPSPPGLPLLPSSAMANASSGAAVNDQCVTKFNELQAKRLHRFITYKLENSKEIVVDVLGERTACYEDFKGALPENDCRFAIFDFDYVTPEDITKSKIFYIFWSPDTARVRSKMLYASSNEKFKQTLNGVHIDMQATDDCEVGMDALKERIKDRIKGRDE